MELSSDTLLLSTKLKTPAPRKNYVVRRTLFEKLSQCADMGIIFICGGAGTGKTTLLASFIQETGLKNVCWVSLDATNTNAYSFWLYFTAAVSAFWDDGGDYLSLMRSNPSGAHMENLLTPLINRLCGDEDSYIVLDDVHWIRDTALVRTLEFFIGAMPSNFHVFMLSREEPPVYLGPLAMSGRLLYIDGKQMQLTAEEGMSFLKSTLHLSEKEEELNRLNDYAEGWIGGLQLAAAAGAGRTAAGHLLRAGGGIAAEYLTREVVKSLTPKEQDFLVKTSFLSYFDAGICSVLFDCFSKPDFDRTINTLIQRNLFIICIDESNGVYRYHNILSDYLEQQFEQLSEKTRSTLYLNAAGILEQRGDLEEALRVLAQAGNYDEILRIARSMDGGIEAWSYLDKVPVELLMQDVDLAAQCFLYNIGNLDVDRCRELYQKFEQYYGSTDTFHILQFMEYFVSQSNGIVLEYHALTAEQIDSLHFSSVAKAMILVENSSALIDEMRYEEAKDCVNRAFELNTGGTNVFVDFFASNQLAQIYEELGRLNDSLACYQKSRKLLKSTALMLGIGTNYYFGLAGVYMRRMELDKATETLDMADALMKTHHIHTDVTDATLLFHRAEMMFLTGDDEAGTARVESYRSQFTIFSVLTMGRLIHELACAEKLPAELADRFLKELEATENYRDQPFMRLLRARLLFKRGETEEALRETNEVLTLSRLHRNQLHLVEAGLLKVIMLIHTGKADEKREVTNLLREAIHYAYADRILMPFYLDRRSLLPLLKRLSVETVGKNAMTVPQTSFVHEILSICDSSTHTEKKPDSLSARELEVLQELSLGLTNREIAEKLCISQATVKTHVLSIFGKFGVSSRLLAVRQGREKGLIK